MTTSSDTLPSRTLLTGASGFIGKHLLQRLVANGQQVTALVRKTADIRDLPGVKWCCGDSNDKQALSAALNDVAVVYHLAAIVPGKGSHTEHWRVNHQATRTLFQACLESGVQR